MKDTNRKVEHGGGEPRTFSAIKGQRKTSTGPTAKNYSDSEAVAKKWQPKAPKTDEKCKE